MTNQVEKFEARESKKKVDEQVIKTEEFKNSTLEKQGQKVANKYGLSTEDIFMIIARDGMEMWTKMWNNSMENVIRETIRNEIKTIVKDVVQDVVQDELSAAARGFMRGIAMAQMESINKPSVEWTKEEQAEFELEPFESVASTAIVEPEVELKSEHKPRYKEFNGTYKFRDKQRLDEMISEMQLEGKDPSVAKNFKEKGASYNTMYQNFMKDNPGRGVWKQYVEHILNN
jgi:hypothetical protein